MALLQHVHLLLFHILIIYVCLGHAETSNPSRLSVLDNSKGQSPCELKDLVNDACSQSQRRDAIVPWATNTLIPRADQATLLDQHTSSCTCNVIFFNIWSACLLSTGNSTLPTFDRWSQLCGQGSFNVDNSKPPIDDALLPPWAKMDKPNPTNTIIDIGAVIMMTVSHQESWTTMQKLAPGVAVIGTCSILLIWFLYHQRSSLRRIKGRFKLGIPFRPPRQVIGRNPNNSWSIDCPGDLDPKKFFASSPNSLETELPDVTYDPPEPPKEPMPRTWKQWPGNLSIPWKSQKTTVVGTLPPRRGFRIDSWDHSTDSSSNSFMNRSSVNPSTGHGTLNTFSLNHATIEEEEEFFEENDDGHLPDQTIEEQESEQLISPIQRSDANVFLISREPGRNFAITDSSSGHGDDIPTRTISPTSDLPASTPPSSSIHSPITRRILAPVRPQPFFPSRPGDLESPQRPSEIKRTFPPVPKLQPPQPSRLSRGYTPANAPQIQLRPEARQPITIPHVPTHFESYLLASPPYDVRQNLPEPVCPTILSQIPEIRVPSSPSYTRRPSDGSSSSPAGHHRFFSSGDETAVLSHLSPLEILGQQLNGLRHQRGLSSEDVVPARSDPVMLFPGSVRAAGYNISPAVSYESMRSASIQQQQQQQQQQQHSPPNSGGSSGSSP